jgi:hypothetical protein
MIGGEAVTWAVREMLARLGPGDGGPPHLRAMILVMMVYDPTRPERFRAELDELCADPDRCVASAALHWKSHVLENEGDPEGGVEAVEAALALVRDELDGPWTAAIQRSQLAQMLVQLGRREDAVVPARLAVPVLGRLGAYDDLLQLQAILALAAVADGRLDEAADQIRRMDGVTRPEVVFNGTSAVRAVAAELAFARGDRATGLAEYRESVAAMRALEVPVGSPTGLEPWVLFSEACALTAYARYASGTDDADGAELFDYCRSRVVGVLDHPYNDFPVLGTVFFGLGAWGLLRSALPAADAVALLVLADRFAYNRMLPTMDWAAVAGEAERLAPGRIAALRAEYGDRRGPDLLDEARAAALRAGAGATSEVPLVGLHGQRGEHHDHHRAGQ